MNNKDLFDYLIEVFWSSDTTPTFYVYVNVSVPVWQIPSLEKEFNTSSE